MDARVSLFSTCTPYTEADMSGSHKIPYFHLGKVDEHQSSHVTSLRNSQRLEIGLYTFERAVHIPSYQTMYTYGSASD